MDPRLETFILYYLCWHEGEISFSDFKQSLLDDLKPEGLKAALDMFRPLRGEYKTYFEAQQ